MSWPTILAAWVLIGAGAPGARAAGSPVDAKLAEIKDFRNRLRADLRKSDGKYRDLEERYARLRKEHRDNEARLEAIRKRAGPEGLSADQAFTALVERQRAIGGQIENAERLEMEYLRTVNSKLRLLESQLETLQRQPPKPERGADGELEAILEQTRRKASADRFKAEDDNRIEEMRKAALKEGGLEPEERKPGIFSRFFKRKKKFKD